MVTRMSAATAPTYKQMIARPKRGLQLQLQFFCWVQSDLESVCGPGASLTGCHKGRQGTWQGAMSLSVAQGHKNGHRK